MIDAAMVAVPTKLREFQIAVLVFLSNRLPIKLRFCAEDSGNRLGAQAGHRDSAPPRPASHRLIKGERFRSAY